MLNFSLSSLLISLVIGSILIGLLQLLLHAKKSYSVIRIDFLFVIASVIMIRLFFPLELISTQTILSYKILPILYNGIEAEAITFMQYSLSFQDLFFIIWFVGCSFLFVRLIYKHLRIQRIIQKLTPQQTTESYKIYRTSIVCSPLVLGVFQPVILLPDAIYSKEEEAHILAHESQHIKNRDLLIKLVIELLVALYWWFFPIYLFRKQASLLLELRVDTQVLEKTDEADYYAYLQSLISVKKKIDAVNYKPSYPIQAAHFTILEENTLRRRIEFLLVGFQNQKTKRPLLLLAFLLPLLATSVIFEPYRPNPADLEGTFMINPERDYLQKNPNGTYELFIDGKSQGVINNIDELLKENIPIKEEKRNDS